MKKVILLAGMALMFVTVNVNAQNFSVNAIQPGGSYNLDYNHVLPPSPTAAAMNKGGDVSVNLSSGAPGIAIPLYTIESRFLKMPLSLNYASNGVRVNDLASDVGLGWSFNGGGSVSRVVLGKPDEERDPDVTPYNNFNTDFTTWTADIFTYSQGDFDRESDIFSFSANGLSGKFIIDAAGLPKLLDVDNVKVQKLSANFTDGFQITDASGVKYIFSEKETSRLVETGYQGPKPFNHDIANAWYLTAVIKPSQDTILLNYAGNTYTYLSNIDESASICIEINRSTMNCQAGGRWSDSASLYSKRFTDRIVQSTIVGKVLSGITFCNGSIDFDYDARKDRGGQALSAITVLDAGGAVIRKFDLVQDYFKSNYASDTYLQEKLISDTSLRYRLYLKELNVVDALGNSPMKYEFYYNNGNGLPWRVSGAQDYYGFFNGAITNKSMLPDISDQYPDLYNRIGVTRKGERAPAPDYMQLGMLYKIKYPTGGYDSIAYDFNKGLEPRYVRHPTFFTLFTNGIGVTGTRTVRDTIHSATRQVVNTNFSARFNACGNIEPDPLHHGGAFSVALKSTGAIIRGGDLRIDQPAVSDTLTLAEGDYIITVSSTGECTNTNYTFNYENVLPDTLIEEKPYGGISVARIKSYDSDDSLKMSKSYSYIKKENGAFSTTKVLRDAMFHDEVGAGIYFVCGAIEQDCQVDGVNVYLNISNNVMNPLTVLGGNFAYHTSVLESVEGNTDNQVIEHKFLFNDPGNPNTVLGDDILNTPLPVYGDQLIGETATNYYRYSKTNGGYILKKSVQNEYNLEIPDQVYNYNVQKVATPSCLWEVLNDAQLSFMNIARYPVFFMRKTLLSTKEQDYSSSDNGTYLENQTTYTYTNNNYLLPAQVTSRTSDNKTLVTSYKYVFDYPSTEIYDTLKQRNEVSIPVETFVQRASAPVKKDFADFKFNNAQKQIALPYLHQEQLQGGPIQTTTTVNAFDNVGHALEIARRAGNISYLWDYNGVYPVAEVANAAQSEIAYTSFESSGKGNWSFGGVPVNGGKTGTKQYNLATGSISRAGVPAGTYLVSYWGNSASAVVSGGTVSPIVNGIADAGGWKFYSYNVTVEAGGTITIGGSGAIDELRLYPAAAQMTTYVYKPLIGLVNACDAKDRITYYEYDALGRLQVIRDHDGKVLKQFGYEYQAPVTQ